MKKAGREEIQSVTFLSTGLQGLQIDHVLQGVMPPSGQAVACHISRDKSKN